MESILKELPEIYKKDIEKAIKILKGYGCTEIFIFGSVSKLKGNSESDIDIAVKGLFKEDYFQIWGKLVKELEHPVDLINLDKNDRFSKFLENERQLVRVA